jgi:hypothetical protein
VKRERMSQFGLGVVVHLLIAAGEEPPKRGGEWIATVDSGQSLRGKWVGQTLPEDPNALHGSWLLLSDTGRILLSGTWSARKAQHGFRGSWSAHDQSRRAVSGTWRVTAGSSGVTTLQQLLEQTLAGQVAGAWRSGRRQGQWWVKGTPSRIGER